MNGHTIYQNDRIQVTDDAIKTGRRSFQIETVNSVSMMTLQRRRTLPIIMIIIGSIIITGNVFNFASDYLDLPISIPFIGDPSEFLYSDTMYEDAVFYLQAPLLVAGGILLLIFVFNPVFVARIATVNGSFNIFKSKKWYETNQVVNAINQAITHRKIL